MKITKSKLPGFLILQPKMFRDDRGFFMETFRASVLADAGIREEWLQDNHSRSTNGVLRGMHFSIGDGQAKLVRCARGAILDVVVDLRRGSPTFAQWDAVRLDDELGKMAYIPVGFGHGFLTLSDVADVVYKCSNYYAAELERGIAFDDPDVRIEWPAEVLPFVSERDRAAPQLADVKDELPFVFESPK